MVGVGYEVKIKKSQDRRAQDKNVEVIEEKARGAVDQKVCSID